jgi:hypothetical protein
MLWREYCTCFAELAVDFAVVIVVVDVERQCYHFLETGEVRPGNMVISISFVLSFLHINSITKTSKSIVLPSLISTRTAAPNQKATSPWSPPATTPTRCTLDG